MFGTVSIPPQKMRQRHRKKVLVAVNKPESRRYNLHCTRANTRTRITMTLLGRRAGTACWLAGRGTCHLLTPAVASPPSRTASTSPTDHRSLTLRPLHEGAATARWRSSKTRQTRIQFRHTPGEFGPTVYLRDLRDLYDTCTMYQQFVIVFALRKYNESTARRAVCARRANLLRPRTRGRDVLSAARRCYKHLRIPLCVPRRLLLQQYRPAAAYSQPAQPYGLPGALLVGREMQLHKRKTLQP